MLIEQVDMQAMQAQLSTVLKVTDLYFHLFHMFLETVQYIAWFVACEVLIAYTASGICYYKDLLLLKRSAILLSSSLPATVHLLFFCSYTAISTGGMGVRADYPAFYRIFYFIQNPYSFSLNGPWRYGFFFFFFFVCEPPFSSSRMLAFCRFDRNIRKILTCRNRADYIYNYSCLRSHCRMFPPALLTFLKLPRM